MSDKVIPDAKDQRIAAELENELTQAHTLIETLQEQIKQLHGESMIEFGWHD